MARRGCPRAGHGTRIWAHGNLEPARATASALGLVVVRELLQMRRPLTDLPPLTRPSTACASRTYSGPADDAELLRVNNAAFAWHPEQGGWTDADIAERRGEAVVRPGRLVPGVRRTDRQSCSAFTGPRCTTADLGEVYVVGVDPAAQGRGLGAALTLVGLHHLAERLSAQVRQAAVMLYVEADNAAAVKTYRATGFRGLSRRRRLRRHSQLVNLVN